MEDAGATSRPTGTVQVLAVQSGPARVDLEANLRSTERLIESAAGDVDLIVLPELFSRPFWCLGQGDVGYFEWAEGVDGPTVSAAARWAKDYSTTVIAPFFERGAVVGEYYNSAAVVGPDGIPITGRLADGRTVPVYRKNAISAYRWGDQVNDEKFYFRPGPGFAVFDTPRARIGVLICLDRWFPEAWRVLALAGAEIVCVVNASQGPVGDLFVPSMRTCAAQCVVYTVAVNKVGTEQAGGKAVSYYGQSCVVGPWGEVLAEASGETSESILASLQLDKIEQARAERTIYRDRRPELYRTVSEERP